MTRQVEADMPVDADETHVANIGKLVEDMELKMRNLLRKSLVLILPTQNYAC
jgi:capping protein beta